MYRLPRGTEADFYLSTGNDPVCCLAPTRSKEVIPVRRFRPGPGAMLLEMPGGVMNEGESPKDGMERELPEETGYRGKVEFATEVFPNAYSAFRKRAFVATDCVKIAEPKPEDNGEELEVVLVSIPEVSPFGEDDRCRDRISRIGSSWVVVEVEIRGVSC